MSEESIIIIAILRRERESSVTRLETPIESTVIRVRSPQRVADANSSSFCDIFPACRRLSGRCTQHSASFFFFKNMF